MLHVHNPNYKPLSSKNIKSRIAMMEDNIQKATIMTLEGEWPLCILDDRAEADCIGFHVVIS
jgi:hypothetical protein